jgi:hypothetical protein
VAPPPRGHSYNLIIHLDRIEDWSPPRVRTPSSVLSGHPSSGSSDSMEYPRIYDFEDWIPGVINGHRQRACPLPCHVPPLMQQQHRPDGDDGHGPRGPPRRFLERGRQACGILRRASNAGAGGSRERTRSPSAYRRRAVGDQGAPLDGDRGRSTERKARGSPRARDPPHREDAD